jgi:superfamily I DNA and/or RNA helicase
MHPALAELPSKEFYQSRVRNGVTSAQRRPRVRFLNPAGQECSRWNLQETVALAAVLNWLYESRIQVEWIG